MRKICSLLLCIALIITMIPGMAFAEDAAAETIIRLVFSEKSDLAEAVANKEITLEEAAGNLSDTVEISANQPAEKYVYLAVYGKDSDGGANRTDLRDVKHVPTEGVEFIADYPGADGEDVVGEDIKDLAYTIANGKFTALYTGVGQDVFMEGMSFYRINMNTGNDHIGLLWIKIKDGESGGNQGSNDTVERLAFSEKSDLAEAVANKEITLEEAAANLSDTIEISANQPAEKYVYLAVYGKDSNGGANRTDLRDVKHVPTEGVEFIADYPGADGEDVVGDDIKDLTYTIANGKFTALYTGAGADTFMEGMSFYRINMNTGNDHIGLLRVVVVNGGNGGNQGSDAPAFMLRIKGTNPSVTATPNDTLYKEFFNKDIELYINGERVFNFDIEQGNGGGVLQIEGPNDGVFRITPVAGGQKVLNIKYGNLQSAFLVDIMENDVPQGGGSVGSQTGSVLVFGENAGIADAVQNGTMTLEAAARKLYDTVDITAGQQVERYVYIAVYGTDGQGRLDRTDLRGVKNVPEGIYMADYPGPDGNDVVGEAIKDLTYEVHSGKLTALYRGEGQDTFAEDRAFYRINLMTSDGQHYGTLRLRITNGQGGNQGGNQGGPVGGSENFRLLDTQLQLINGQNVAFDALPGGTPAMKSFYIVYNGGEADRDLSVMMTDHYRTMHNYDENYGQRVDVAVTDSEIEFTEIERNNRDFQVIAEKSGFRNTDGLYIFKADVKSDALRDFTFRKSGLVRGKLHIMEGEERTETTEVMVTAAGFDSQENILFEKNTDNIHFTDENGDGDLDETTYHLFANAGSDINRIFLTVAKDGTEPTVEAYSKYEGAFRGYVFEHVVDADLFTMEPYKELADGSDVYQIILKEGFGHNDLILKAFTSVNGQVSCSSLVVNKALKYEFDTDAFTVAEESTDYMNALTNEYFDTNFTQRVRVKSTYTDENGTSVTVMMEEDKGGTRSGNMPNSGGYYGTFIKLADGARLKGIVTTGYSGNTEVETHLNYGVNQAIFYKVTDKRDDSQIDAEDFPNYNFLQIPRSMRETGEYLVEVDIPMAEYRYNEDAGAYRIDPNFRAVSNAAQAYGNLASWLGEYFGAGNYEIQLLNTCIYYDISCSDADVNNLHDLYDKLDKIGCIKFITEDDSAEFEGNVGFKPADDLSGAIWKEEDLAGMNAVPCDEEDTQTHEENLAEFNGSEDETVVGAYQLGMEDEEANFKGMLDVYIPIPDSVDESAWTDCKVYWMNEGSPVPMAARCVDGYMVFTTSHFSDYVLVADADAVTEDGSGEGGDNTGGNEGGNEGGNQGGNEGGGTTGGGSWIPSIPSVPAVNPLNTAKTEASKTVTAYVDQTQYDEAEADEIAAIIEQAKKDIEAAKTEEEIKAIEEAVKAELDKLETAEEKALIAEVKDTKFKAKSKMTTLRGKRAVKITWNVPEGMEFDGFEVYRSTERYKGFGTKPYFETTKTSYTNNKDLKVGKTYYYKVRAFKYVNDEKVYTEYSFKAFRTIKKK